MELNTVKELARLLDMHGLSRLEVSDGNERYVLEKPGHVEALPRRMENAFAVSPEPPAAETEKAEERNGEVQRSSLVGTVYLSPAEGKPPFVSVGDRVKKGDTLCIIEAMKILNEIPSEYDGTVKEILVENEDNVDFGRELFVIG